MKRRKFLKTSIATSAVLTMPGLANRLLSQPDAEASASTEQHYKALPRLNFKKYPELRNLTKIYVVSPGGNDQNHGTQEMPFQTISQAAQVLQPGEGVFVRAGIYRERVSPQRGGEPEKPIVYFAEPGNHVLIKGSDLWSPSWTQISRNIFSAKPDEKMFTDDYYVDSANPLRVAVCATPWGREGRAEYEYFGLADRSNGQNGMSKADLEHYVEQCDKNLAFTLGQVFVDGKLFRQMPYRADMEASAESWFYDAESGSVSIHLPSDDSPESHSVELTTRRRIFAPHQRGLGYIHVIGFTMEHCGNQYPKDFWAIPAYGQAGALGTRAGHHWTIRKNIVRFANGFGLDIGAEGKSNERRDDTQPVPGLIGYHTIEGNVVTDNGAGGICGAFPKQLHIEGNLIARNNSLRFKGKKRWESAGLKLHTPDGSLISRNLILDNYTYGFWSDGGAGKGMRFTRNAIVGNSESEHGVFIEMGVYGPDTAFIDNNVIIGNRNGFYCHDGSGVTVMHNLLANSRDYGIQVRQVGPRCNTRNHAFFNNLVIGNTNVAILNFPSELGGNIRLNGNVYSSTQTDLDFFVSAYSKFAPPWTESEFMALVSANFEADQLNKTAFDTKDIAKLNFAEWKQFWSKFSSEDDALSALTTDAEISLNPQTLELTLALPRDATTRLKRMPQLTMHDFLGHPVSNTCDAIAGPFQQPVHNRIAVQLSQIVVNAHDQSE